MAQDLKSRLDAEADERLDPFIEKYNSGGSVRIADIFSKEVVVALGRSSTFLSGADSSRIMTSIPFYETVFVGICYKCAETRNINPIRPLLQSGPVVPVLLNSYSSYPEAFLREVVRYPHMGRKEFSFYRDTTIMAASAQKICGHCAQQKLKDLLNDPAAGHRVVKEWARRFFSYLVPFVAPDFTLVDQFCNAVKQRNFDQVWQLMTLAMTINSIRTAQALGSAQAVPLDGLIDLPTDGNIEPLLNGVSIDALKKVAADELGLIIPKSLSPDQYLEIILPFQKRLCRLVGEIIKVGQKTPYAKVIETVQTINYELRKMAGSKRFLAYRAIAGFAAGNSALIGGLLVGGALGMGGHLAGCGATVVTAIGSKLIKKWKPVRDNRALKQLGRSVRASLQPAVAKVLSAYLGISTRAVEVWQLRQEMIDQPLAIAVGSDGRKTIRVVKKSGKRGRRVRLS